MCASPVPCVRPLPFSTLIKTTSTLVFLAMVCWPTSAVRADAAAALMEAAKAGDEAKVLELKEQIAAKPKPPRGDKKKARALNEEALKLLRAGDFPTAIERLAAAARADSADTEVLGNLGYALIMMNRAAEAKPVFEKALDLSPSRSATWGNLGEAYAALGDEPSAIAALRLAYLFSRNRDKTIAYFTLLIEKPGASPTLIAAARKAREAPTLATQNPSAKIAGEASPALSAAPSQKPTPLVAALNEKLFSALQRGNDAEFHHLLLSGADPNGRNEKGYTPLMIASDLNYDTMVLLLMDRADVNAKNDVGETALIIACAKGHEEIVNNLLAAGADVNGKDNGGNTPLISASLKGHDGIADTLLAKGADVNASATNGLTALIRASETGSLRLASALIQKNADVNAAYEGGVTALMFAAQNGHLAIVRELLAHGAAVNATDAKGRTALFRASWNGHDAVVKALLDKGADAHVRSNAGETACSVGARHIDVVKLLLLKSAACPRVPLTDEEAAEVDAIRREFFAKHCMPVVDRRSEQCLKLRRNDLVTECMNTALEAGESCLKQVEPYVLDTWRGSKL